MKKLLTSMYVQVSLWVSSIKTRLHLQSKYWNSYEAMSDRLDQMEMYISGKDLKQALDDLEDYRLKYNKVKWWWQPPL